MNCFIKIYISSLFIFSLFFSNNALSQFPPAKKDSLLSIWNDSREKDSIRMDAIRHLAWHGYLFTQPDSTFYFAQLHFDFAKERGDSLQMAVALNVQATALNFQGEFDKAIEYYNQSLTINEARDDVRGIGAILNNVGNIYRKQGNFPKATEYFFRSLQIREQAQDVIGAATSLGNLGVLYMEQDKLDEAADYFNRSLSHWEEIGHELAIAGTLNNLGLIYAKQGDLEKALETHLKSLEIREEMNSKRGIAESMINIGGIHRELGEYNKAIDNFEQSLTINKESGDRNGEASSLYNLGRTYAQQAQFVKAISFGDRALALATEVGNISIRKDAHKLLYDSNKSLNRSNQALDQFEAYVQLRDSIYKEENREELIRQQFQYDYDREKALMMAEQTKKDAVIEKRFLQKQQRQNIMIILFVVSIIVLIGIGWFVIRDRKAKYKFIVAQSELKTLRSQLKPHFVFNVLNSIHTFILNEDSRSASKYLLSFSKVMRSTLESMNKDMNTLQEEVDLLQKIVDLEGLRLRKKIELTVNNDKDWSDYMIPAMILQPIVENAIIHGVQHAPDDTDEIAIQIDIHNNVLSIKVQNRHHGKLKINSEASAEQAKRFGFSITRERVILINKKHKIKEDVSIQFNEHHTNVSLTLPMIIA